MHYNFTIRALQGSDLSFYRIDWFGEVQRQGLRGGRLSLVELVISLWNNRGDKTQGENLHRRNIFVPIAFLRYCRIGDIWRAGACCGSDASITREVFKELEISDELFDVKPAGLPLANFYGQDLYPLPFDQFEGHRGHTGAYCVRLKVSADTTLVVPCMELIRFYFGASGSFLKRLFSGAFGMDSLYSSAKIDPVTKRASLDLANDVPGVGAATVGRIAFDKYAASAARWIVKSGVVASANGDSYYPKSTFPFRGRTNLTAEGRWILQADHRVFLAERLVSCTHPFPFDQLFYTSHIDLSTKRTDPKMKESATINIGSKNNRTAIDKDILIEEGFVAHNLQSQSFRVDAFEPPFPDLLSKLVRRVKQREKAFPQPSVIERQTSLAEGETRPSEGARGVEVTSEPVEISTQEMPAEAVEVFGAVFRELSKNLSYKTRLRQPFSVFNYENPLPGFFKTNFLIRESHGKNAEVWCARIEFAQHLELPSLFALVRCNVNQETATHIAVVRDVVGGRYDNNLVKIGIQDLCTVFSQERIFEIGQSNILGVLDTTRATDASEVLSFLERIISLGMGST